MSGRNPKGAALGQSHYESSEIVDCFEDLIKPLTIDLKQREPTFTARDLSLFVGQLQQFQQECLGAFNRPPNAPVRIPAKLFKVNPKRQLTKDSAIYTMLKSAYRFRINHGWKKWDFSNPAKKQKNADLVQAIRNQLIKKRYIMVPKIAIMEPVPDTTRKTITSLVKKIGASLVEDKNDATHILYGKLHEYNTEGIEEDWFRTLEKDGPLVLVHWWYYPDSFDSWLPQTQQFADPEEPPEHTGPWRISVRWLQDTVRFNELMNEEDYEDVDEEEEEEEEEEDEDEDDEEEEDEEENTSVVDRKRKLSEMDTTITPAAPATTKPMDIDSSKEATSSMDSTTELSQSIVPELPVPVLHPDHQPVVRVRDIAAEKPQVGSRQRKNEFEPYVNGDITNISQYIAAHVEYPKRPTKIQKLEETTDEKAINIPSLIKSMPYDYEDLELPQWFHFDLIHDLERLALPEFFKGDSLELTPEKYKTYRNYMINTYKANPDYYLTISACKSKLDVDLVTLVRIHSFLESYNLINSRPDPRRRIFDPYIDSDPTAQIKPKSQRNFKDIENADIEYLRKLIYNEAQVAPIRSSWDLTVEDPNNPDSRKIFHCSNCKVDCSEIRYQSLKVKNFQVCIDCFLEGRFPATLFSGDFLRVEAGDDLDIEEEWTDNEILRLLEGVDRFDDDWLLISEHVGSRSKEQCITKFLQLPINDEFLTAQLSKKELEELPFGDLPNPVMTTIAFLSGHINPGVGAAAAKTALKELMKSGEGRMEPMEVDAKIKTDESELDTKIKSEESVDIDMDQEEEEKEEEKTSESTTAFSKDLMKKATTSALKSAVESARKLASYEDEEIQHWTRLAVKTMVDKLSFKVQQYDELETSLENELTELEKQHISLATQIDATKTQHFPLHGSGEESSVVTPPQVDTLRTDSTITNTSTTL